MANPDQPPARRVQLTPSQQPPVFFLHANQIIAFPRKRTERCTNYTYVDTCMQIVQPRPDEPLGEANWAGGIDRGYLYALAKLSLRQVSALPSYTIHRPFSILHQSCFMVRITNICSTLIVQSGWKYKNWARIINHCRPINQTFGSFLIGRYSD